MGQHAAGQDFFNNGTLAWEASDFRTAIANYANASMNYTMAAKDYVIMARYARGTQEKEFADSLRGCAFNLSQASDNFVNAAIALGQNDSNAAYDWFSQGQAHVDASEALLNRSIAATPGWLITLASG
jgi:rubrerythrin